MEELYWCMRDKGIRAVYQTDEEHVGPTINVKVY